MELGIVLERGCWSTLTFRTAPFEGDMEACLCGDCARCLLFAHLTVFSPPPSTGSGGNDNIDIKLDDKYTSKAGGGKLGIDDFELLKVLGKGSFGKVRCLGRVLCTQTPQSLTG